MNIKHKLLKYKLHKMLSSHPELFLCILYFNNLYVLGEFVGNIHCTCKNAWNTKY
jgi:hypothetical protein